MGRRAYVGNCPFTADEAQIRDFFRDYEVTEVKIVTDRENGRPRGFCFVEFATEDQLQNAVHELDGSEMGGRTLKVNEAQERSGGRGGSRQSHDRGDRGRGRGDY